ncbi:hypothetical protein KPH14_001564 [Odynerus spinipes]|uniref:Uncharacterized protein n=1 Tax=Odynerus spinipes TaxID=1348599 RepID=A0AAD9VVM5_9HYME|nr:hypothetical protein KPH14_001564 [Odynerus spinipes]
MITTNLLYYSLSISAITPSYYSLPNVSIPHVNIQLLLRGSCLNSSVTNWDLFLACYSKKTQLKSYRDSFNKSKNVGQVPSS